MSNLAILNTSIRSFENLFSLNDLHKSSGGLEKHSPRRFTRLDTTKDLIQEIEKDGNAKALKVIRGTQGGTYVCEELVLSYAMWISPKFHLIVLRAFLSMHKNEQLQNSQQLALPEPEKTFSFELTQDNIHNLVWLLFSHSQMNWLLGKLIKPLEAIGSSYSPAVVGHHNEYKRHYRDCLPLIQQFIAPLKQANPQEWQQLQRRLSDK